MLGLLGTPICLLSAKAADAVLLSPSTTSRSQPRHVDVSALPRRFDLDCRITAVTTISGIVNTDVSDEIYRIDLPGQLYCRAACTAARRVLALTPDTIVLEDATSTPPPPAGIAATQQIDRRTLRVEGHVEVGRDFTVSVNGPCTLAPFISIPASARRTTPQPAT